MKNKKILLDKFLNNTSEEDYVKGRVKGLLMEELTMEEAISLGNKNAIEKLKKKEEERVLMEERATRKQEREDKLKVLKEKLESQDVDIFLDGLNDQLIDSNKDLESVKHIELQVLDKLGDLEVAKARLEDYLEKCSILKSSLEKVNTLVDKVTTLKEGVEGGLQKVQEGGSIEDLDLSRWWGEDAPRVAPKKEKTLTIQEAYDKVWEDKERVQVLKEQDKAKEAKELLEGFNQVLE